VLGDMPATSQSISFRFYGRTGTEATPSGSPSSVHEQLAACERLARERGVTIVAKVKEVRREASARSSQRTGTSRAVERISTSAGTAPTATLSASRRLATGDQ
jgi:hypothetical protein